MNLRASPSTFVGRKAHRYRVAQLWPKSRIVVIVGSAGVGKSTLMRRLIEELGEGKPTYWYGCGSGEDVLGGIEATLDLPALVTSMADRLLRIASRLAAVDGILCVDDVHRLDTEQSTLWELAAHLRAGRIVATSRSAVSLGDLEASAAVVPLGPLSPEEATTLVRELLERLGREGDPRFLAFRAAGNPLWCRLLAGGAERVERHLDSVLGALDPKAIDALARLSLFREPVPVEWSGADLATAHDLEMRCLVDRTEDGTLSVHDVVRDIMSSRLTAADRARLHRECAALYARDPSTGIEGELHHLEAAGDARALAVTLHERGGAWLWAYRRVARFQRLVTAAERAGVQLTPRLCLRRALCHVVEGRIDAARAAFVSAGAVPEEDALLAAAVEIDLLREVGAPFELREERFERAFAGKLGTAADRGPLVDGYVRDAVLMCHLEPALRVYRKVLESPGLVDELSLGRTANRVGYGLIEQGDPEEAAAAMTVAETCAKALGSAYLSVANQCSWTVLLANFGDLDAARARLEEAQRVPEATSEATSQVNLEVARSAVLTREGRLATAREGLETCCARGLALMSPIRAALYAELSSVCAEMGDTLRAQSAALEARRSRRTGRWDIAHVGAHTALARAEIALGRLARGQRRARLAMAISARRGIGHRLAVAQLVFAEAAIALGNYDEALATVTHVVERARQTGASRLEVWGQLLTATAALRRRAGDAALAAAGEALRVARRGGHGLLAARANVLLALALVLKDRDTDAVEQLGAATGARSLGELPALEAEIELVERLLRARGGSPRARKMLEERLAGATTILATIVRAELRRLDAATGRAVVTRGGTRSAASGGATPEAHDLWLDESTGRARVDAATEVDLRSRPVLLRLLRVVLSEPARRLDKAQLLSDVWKLPYRQTREPMLQKAVQRLGHLLSPEDPHRFFTWDPDGKLRLKAERPGLVVVDAATSLNDRQKWLVAELARRATISSGEYRSALSIPRVTAYRDLEHLVELGLIRRRGRGRAVVYERPSPSSPPPMGTS